MEFCDLKLLYYILSQERLLKEKEEKDSAILPNPKSDWCTAGDALISKESAIPVISSASPQLSAPLFAKKSKVQDTATGVKNSQGKMDSEDVKNSGEVKNDKLEEAKKEGNGSVEGKVKPQRPFGPLSRTKDDSEKGKSVVGEENKLLQRPSNPFLKSTIK